MRIRRLFLPVGLTIGAAVLALRVLSVYVPVSPMANVPGVAARFNGEQAMHYLDSLTHQFKGRVVGSAQGFAAADYVAAQFRSYGLKVEVQNFREAGAAGAFESGWYVGRNIIGVLPGWGKGSVALTAHRDCVSKAPEGAYDNGSGTAAVLELARVLAAGGPHRYTYVFGSLDGEEIGFAGARVLMNHCQEALKDIRLMINLDMVGLRDADQWRLTHTQYLSAEARALAASHFKLRPYDLFQIPMGRGTDAQLYVWRGMPAIDVSDSTSVPGKSGQNHNASDTYSQISAGSIQRLGRAVEQLILQGDAIDAFTPSNGLTASEEIGVLAPWRYRLGGAFILVMLAIPLLFRLRLLRRGGRAGLVMAALVVLIGILTAVSTLWSGSVIFAGLSVLGTIVVLVLQTVALLLTRSPDSGIGRLIVAAVPPFLFAGTWLLTGVWPLGLWMAAPAYLPAVFVTWKTGWGWRILDIVLLLPSIALIVFVAVVSWMSAPLHLFPAVKLALFVALYMAAALAGIWGIFGRRPPRRELALPDPEPIPSC
jgi:hypothetical protein